MDGVRLIARIFGVLGWVAFVVGGIAMAWVAFQWLSLLGAATGGLTALGGMGGAFAWSLLLALSPFSVWALLKVLCEIHHQVESSSRHNREIAQSLRELFRQEQQLLEAIQLATGTNSQTQEAPAFSVGAEIESHTSEREVAPRVDWGAVHPDLEELPGGGNGFDLLGKRMMLRQGSKVYVGVRDPFAATLRIQELTPADVLSVHRKWVRVRTNAEEGFVAVNDLSTL